MRLVPRVAVVYHGAASGHATSTGHLRRLRSGNDGQLRVGRRGRLRARATRRTAATPRPARAQAPGDDDAACLACHAPAPPAARLRPRRSPSRTATTARARRASTTPARGATRGAGACRRPRRARARHVDLRGLPRPALLEPRARAVAPPAPGALAGAWGVDLSGPARRSPCASSTRSASSATATARTSRRRSGRPSAARVRRAVEDLNLRRVFSAASPVRPTRSRARGGTPTSRASIAPLRARVDSILLLGLPRVRHRPGRGRRGPAGSARLDLPATCSSGST